MQARVKALAALATLMALGGLLLAGARGAGIAAPARIAFQIATGSSGGGYFPVGQAIAGFISHPPGVDRCEMADVCGPTGLIMSARTSDGAVDNLRQVDSGAVDSGLAQDDTILATVAGKGAYAKPGKLVHVRAIAALFVEDVQLVATVKSKIAKVSDLRNKRVSLGTDDSGVSITASEILAAWRLPEWRLHALHESSDDEVTMMRDGKLDAFFFVGAPDPEVSDLIGHGIAKLIPIDGAERDRLVKAAPGLKPAAIPAGTYPNMGALQTVSTRAVWVVHDSEPDALVYGIVHALFNPANRVALATSYAPAHGIGLDGAAQDLPAPLHSGAARYYRETGKLPKTN
jgi:uncharacterized protein